MKHMIKVIMLMVLVGCLVTGCAKSNTEQVDGTKHNGEQQVDATTSPSPVETASNTPEASTVPTEESTSSPTTESAKKTTLVVYFSCTGTTKKMAEYAAEVLDADLYEIVPETPYTEDDLNYKNSSARAVVEQGNSKERPAIVGSVENIEQYEKVVLGYPIWMGKAPRIISTFLESYDLSNKTILPFCTSHSTDIGDSAKNLHKLCADSVSWGDGIRFLEENGQEDMEAWLLKEGALVK